MNWLDCCDKHKDLTHELGKNIGEFEKFIENHNSPKLKKKKTESLISIKEIESITYNFPIMKTSRLRRQSTLSFQYLQNNNHHKLT